MITSQVVLLVEVIHLMTNTEAAHVRMNTHGNNNIHT